MPSGHNYQPQDSLSVGEAARLLGCSVDTLVRWEGDGRISSSRTPGGHRRFKFADVQALLDTPAGDGRVAS